MFQGVKMIVFWKNYFLFLFDVFISVKTIDFKEMVSRYKILEHKKTTSNK